MTTAGSPINTRDDARGRQRVTAETMSLRQFLQVADRYHVCARDLQYSERDCEMLEAVQQVTNLAAPKGPREAAIARLADEWNRLYVDSTPPAPSPTIFPGDVVRHQDTGRIAVVVQTGRTWPDSTVEHHVRVVSSIGDEERPFTDWSAANIQLHPCRDPYRAYLALVASEKNPAHIARRLLHGRHARRFGPPSIRGRLGSSVLATLQQQTSAPDGGDGLVRPRPQPLGPGRQRLPGPPRPCRAILVLPR